MGDSGAGALWVRTAELTTQELAASVGEQLEAGDLILLNVELGAGKTTFI